MNNMIQFRCIILLLFIFLLYYLLQYNVMLYRTTPKLDSSHSLTAGQFSLLAPYHVVFDSNFKILQMSDSMRHSSSAKKAPSMVGSKLTDKFRISAVGMDCTPGMDWDEFHTAALLTIANQQSCTFDAINAFTKSGKPCSYVGKIIFLTNEFGVDHAAVFLCSPNVDTLEEMCDQDVSVNDLKNKDDSRMQMLLNRANMKHFEESALKVSSIDMISVKNTNSCYNTIYNTTSISYQYYLFLLSFVYLFIL
jgi:hypothetical protein